MNYKYQNYANTSPPERIKSDRIKGIIRLIDKKGI